jgi:hypothetical protein
MSPSRPPTQCGSSAPPDDVGLADLCTGHNVMATVVVECRVPCRWARGGAAGGEPGADLDEGCTTV